MQEQRGVRGAYIDNVPHIVQKRDVDVQAGGDQPGSLEQVVVVLLPCSSGPFRWQRGRGWCELSVLVDGPEVVTNVVVDAVEHDQQNTDAGGHPEETLVGKTVGFQLSILESPDGVLHLLVASVQRREIQIRRRLGLVHVPVVCPEKVCSPLSAKLDAAYPWR